MTSSNPGCLRWPLQRLLSLLFNRRRRTAAALELRVELHEHNNPVHSLRGHCRLHFEWVHCWNLINMPADVAVAECSSYLRGEPPCWNPETMSGSMTLIGSGGHCQDVQVKVYRTSLEHFAVLYPQKKVCRPLGVINLRNTRVEPLTNAKGQPGFTLRQQGFDTPMCLTFLSESARDLDAWLAAFGSSSPSSQPTLLPVLSEDDEL